MRRKSRKVQCGGLSVGGDASISVQSMTTTDPVQVEETVGQIKRLEEAGCDLVRVAVPTLASAKALGAVRSAIAIPLVADIHFDYRIALEAIHQGIDGLRINPGNIGDESRVEAVVKAAKERKIPIRIGVNAGSLERSLLQQYGKPTAEAMVASALNHVRILEALDFHDIVISLKASSVELTVEAYEKMADACDYPLHLGITEAGTPWAGTIKSAIGIGSLLLKGIGDTLRVSLTGDPVEEIRVGRQILRSLELLPDQVTLISCPTCGRCQINLIRLAQQVEEKIAHLNKPIKVAVMGCAVNGPGEAREADIGIAGGSDGALLFKKGEVLKKVPEDQILNALLEEIEKL